MWYREIVLKYLNELLISGVRKYLKIFYAVKMCVQTHFWCLNRELFGIDENYVQLSYMRRIVNFIATLSNMKSTVSTISPVIVLLMQSAYTFFSMKNSYSFSHKPNISACLLHKKTLNKIRHTKKKYQF